jgi:thiol-disulfide isomerase/thioredoxin
LEAFDKKLAAATTEAQKATVHAQRSDLLEKLAADAKNTEEKSQWIRQIADMVSVAVQAGEYPDGTGRLKQLIERLQKEKALDELTAYVQFRYLSADYGQQLQANDADFAKVQAAWLESLTGYVEQYPKSTDAADAMLQLAVGQEFSGKEDDAAKWYGRIVTEHPKSVAAKKAAGAKLRLESVGKTIALRGETIDGKSVDLAKYKGRVVLIHYWATWCEPCKSDMEQLKALQKKYEQRGFSLIGVSFDENAQTLASTLRRDPLAWAQIHESGGLDGRLANELGILTLPTMLLVDEEGKVVNRNIHVSEIEAELKKRIR